MKKLFTLFAFTLMAIASYAAVNKSGTCSKDGDNLTCELSDNGKTDYPCAFCSEICRF